MHLFSDYLPRELLGRGPRDSTLFYGVKGSVTELRPVAVALIL